MIFQNNCISKKSKKLSGSFKKIESVRSPSVLGDSSYSYFRKGKLHTVRRVYIQRLAYDPQGNLIGEKILKEVP
jgi:hypothetical protein